MGSTNKVFPKLVLGDPMSNMSQEVQTIPATCFGRQEN